MERNRFSLSNLREFYDRGDTANIISSLLLLKEELRTAIHAYDVDRDTCKMLIDLLTHPNAKILEITMGILANCCVRTTQRDLFEQLGGISPLMSIVRSIANDDILAKAYRLIGNLATNYFLAAMLNDYNAGYIILKSLDYIPQRSNEAVMMILRAATKLWVIKEYQVKMLPENLHSNLYVCLGSTEEALVSRALEAISLFSSLNSCQTRNVLKITREMLLKIIELTANEELYDVTMKCLSNLVYYQTSQVWRYLEGSGLPDIFIKHIQRMNYPNRVVLEAFYKLCTEGSVRNKVKTAGLFPKLLTYCNGGNIDIMLMTFCLFQYDLASIETLARNKVFIHLLTRNIEKKGATRLLSVVCRLEPPVQELIAPENLNILIRQKECHGILKKIMQTKKFLTQLILSGRIWEVSQANCLVEDQNQYAEALLIHLLRTGSPQEVENAALAVPFLVRPRHFTLYNILAHNNGITTIIRLLKERTLEERILATIVKLISIFQMNFYTNNQFSRGFFDDCVIRTRKVRRARVDTRSNYGFFSNPNAQPQNIIFELDCGTCLTMDKTLLCRHSPVFDAMFNGSFLESTQEKVKLSCCSAEALQFMETLLKRRGGHFGNVDIHTYLEAVTLTDRFIMPGLCDYLTAHLPLSQATCVTVLLWCRNSGYSRFSGLIKHKIYEFIFSSSENLLIAMQDDTIRPTLVDEISTYLNSSFLDFL